MKRRPRSESLPICGVLLAGGRGTRFWPRSRLRTPKQLLNITGGETMLRETAARLHPLIRARNLWVVTNAEQAKAVRAQLRGVPASRVIAEPVGRNTAAAVGLTAIHLIHKHGDALMAVLPSDSYVADAPRYRKLMQAALELVRESPNMAVFGIPPTHPETGYGYIELGGEAGKLKGAPIAVVRRFTEKPALPLARRYVASGKYLWNAGMFFWRASTFLESLREFLPRTHAALEKLAPTIGTGRYGSALRRIYPQLENISIDYGIMEPATRTSGPRRVFVVPAKIGWSDIGSWAAVYDFLTPKPGGNASVGPLFALEAHGNYFWSPKKFAAAIGVRNLIVVETDDALLVCERGRSQDVGKIVKWLEEHKKTELL